MANQREGDRVPFDLEYVTVGPAVPSLHRHVLSILNTEFPHCLFSFPSEGLVYCPPDLASPESWL